MDPFKWQRANTWDDKEIRGLFVPPSVYGDMERKAHHILLGNAASGKTMVLRSLSFSTQWQEGEEFPKYIGVYVPLTEGMLAPFKEAYRESTRWEVFGHYFNLVVAERICHITENYLLPHISEEGKLVKNLLPIFNLERQVTTFHEFGECLREMQKQACDFVNREITLGKDSFPGYCTDILMTIRQMCKELRSCLTKILCREICFYLLIDGYERLKELAVVVNTLLEDENCNDFCMKIATTRIVDLLPQAVRGVEPKAGRDYQIASLEHTEPLAYHSFLKRIAAKRLDSAREENHASKLFTDIEELLSSEPSQLEKRETGYLGIGPVEKLQKIDIHITDVQTAKDYIWLLKLKRLREKEKESKDELKSKRRNLYYSFPVFASLSSGVVTNFLRLCSEAFKLAESKKIKVWEGEPIPSDIQGEAALTVARQAFDEIVSTSGEYGSSLANFVYNFAGEIEGNLDDEALDLERTHCLGIEISDIANLASDPKLVEMVKRGLQESILLTEGRMNLERAGILPANFSINAIYSPRFGISYRQKYYLSVKTSIVADWVAKDVPGRPSSPFKALPKEPEAPRMIEDILGFLAVSFKEQDKRTREVVKKEFRKVILQNIQREKSLGKPIPPDEVFFDAEDIAILGGLEEKSLAGLRKASFCVAELSMLRPNVFMELGMAMALKKQYYMIWDIDKRDFNPDLLPDYLQNLETVPFTCALSKWNERRKQVHRILTDFQRHPHMLCPWHKNRRCDYEPINEKDTYFFLYYSLENQEGYDEIFKNLAKKQSQICGIDPIPQDEQRQPHELCRICYSIQRAKYCIVDTTEPSYSSAFVWGFAYALNKPLLDIYRKDKEGLPSMLKGHPSYGWDPSKEGEDIFQAFRDKVYSS